MATTKYLVVFCTALHDQNSVVIKLMEFLLLPYKVNFLVPQLTRYGGTAADFIPDCAAQSSQEFAFVSMTRNSERPHCMTQWLSSHGSP